MAASLDKFGIPRRLPLRPERLLWVDAGEIGGERLVRLQETLAATRSGELLACWYSELGVLNQILIIQTIDDQTRLSARREKMLIAKDPFGVGEHRHDDGYLDILSLRRTSAWTIRPRL